MDARENALRLTEIRKLIQSTNTFKYNNLPEYGYDRHAGYRKYSTQKGMLHNSMLAFKEANVFTEDECIVTSITSTTIGNYELCYHLYFPDINKFIEIYTDAGYESINLNWNEVEQGMNDWLVKKLKAQVENHIKQDKIKDEPLSYYSKLFNTFITEAELAS